MCSCDIPAARKVSGFLGHRATKGCSRCQLFFPTDHFSEKADYTNFNRALWEKRDNASHRLSEKHKVSNTKVERVEIEKKYGVRYSCSLQLPYFYAPRMCVIDPMHNLLSGTAKHVLIFGNQLGCCLQIIFVTFKRKWIILHVQMMWEEYHQKFNLLSLALQLISGKVGQSVFTLLSQEYTPF